MYFRLILFRASSSADTLLWYVVVVAKLVEQSLPTQEVRGLNLTSDIFEQFSTNCNLERKKIVEFDLLITWHRRLWKEDKLSVN